MQFDDSHLLLTEAQNGDSPAFHRLILPLDSAVFQTALRITGSPDAAAKLYRRTFFRVYRKLRHFHLECSFSDWVLRHFAQLCLDHLRRYGPLVRSSDGQSIAGTLFLLTPHERLIAELKFGLGFSLPQIAQILGIPPGVARLSFLLAMGKLRAARNAGYSKTLEEEFAEEVT